MHIVSPAAAGLVALLAISSSSAAQEAHGNAANFSGWNVFAAAQALTADNQQVYRASLVAKPAAKSVGAEGVGVIVGGGYDIAVGDIGVAGIFASLGTGNEAIHYSDAVSSALFEHDTNLTVDAGIRLGLAPTTRQLLYVTGGHSWSDYTTISRGVGGVAYARTDSKADGWFGGLGFDYRLTENIDLKTEYRARVIDRGSTHVVGARSWTFAPLDHTLMVGLALRPGRKLSPQDTPEGKAYVDGVSFYGGLGLAGGIFDANWRGYQGGSSEHRASQFAGIRVSAGADIAIGESFLAGATAAYAFRGARSNDDAAPPASRHEVSLDDAWSLGLRAGLRTDAGLLYVGGGYVQSAVDGKHFSSTASDMSADLHGLYGSLGTEVALGDHLGLQLEYRVEHFQNVSQAALPIDQEIDMNTQSVSAGLLFRY